MGLQGGRGHCPGSPGCRFIGGHEEQAFPKEAGWGWGHGEPILITQEAHTGKGSGKRLPTG